MTILLDSYSIPAKGSVELNVHLVFDIRTTAEEAQKLVQRWLLNEVSYLLRSLLPSLAIGEHVVWRVPISIGYPDLGQIGVISVIDVDVQTGELFDQNQVKKRVEAAAEALAKRLPSYTSRSNMPGPYVPVTISPVATVVITD